MPEPDCFLQYHMRCNVKFYYVGKIPPIDGLQRRVVLQWFYSTRAVGTTLSEVHALYQVPFYAVWQKMHPFYFCSYFFKPPYISIIFGKQILI